ncbi:MAG: glycosyltransferase [Armatimonadetes bacterium]|nr:glycosyltransferase [Armatimonadota bacterium]
MKKLLYLDVPFAGATGGDKNRSRFIWETLTSNFDADLLLINRLEHSDEKINPHSGDKNHFILKTKKWNFFSSRIIFCFSRSEIKRFKDILQNGKYEIVFFRFASPTRLAAIVSKTLPDSKIIIDIDMLFSRLSKLSWNLNPTFKNRYYLVEKIKQQIYEKRLFNLSYSFLFTNFIEKEIVENKYVKKSAKGNFDILPNVMKEQSLKEIPEKENCILFFGGLSSAANEDAFKYLISDIYPLISQKLSDKNIFINIVGRNPTPIYEYLLKKNEIKNIKIIGEVADVNLEIAKALFVVLPLRIASGTRTRILEAANLKITVITTSIGAEGFDFSENEIIIRDSAEELAEEINNLIDNPERAEKIGENFYKKCKKIYLDKNVGKELIKKINS